MRGNDSHAEQKAEFSFTSLLFELLLTCLLQQSFLDHMSGAIGDQMTFYHAKCFLFLFFSLHQVPASSHRIVNMESVKASRFKELKLNRDG